jgi:predicted small integral membrane protein
VLRLFCFARLKAKRFNLALTKLGSNQRMRRLLIPLFLAACGAQPTPLMFGAERIETTRGGREYVVFMKENMIEVIRLGYARRGEHAAIRETMIALIPEVTGCNLVESTLTGDSGEMRARVTCPRAPA